MVILVTGISSGFGLETARLLAEEGYVVYGTVRRDVEPLTGVHYLKVDVRDRIAVKGAVQQVIDREGRIDVLVNNAGMGIGGPVEFATEEEIREQMDANFDGPAFPRLLFRQQVRHRRLLRSTPAGDEAVWRQGRRGAPGRFFYRFYRQQKKNLQRGGH